MNAYFSTFPAGFGDVVQQALKSEITGVQIKLTLDGLIVYETEAPTEKINQLKFFSNSFLLFDSIDNFEATFTKKTKSFRVIFSRENQLISVNKEYHLNIEKIISQKTGLVVDRSKPDVEFWFLKRSEGHDFFGLRITMHPSYDKTLEKGELRPEIAYLLSFLSEPSPEDVFLDPFAGSGAIPRMRLKMAKAKKVISYDKNMGDDALNMKNLTDESVDKIVTDPPWGIYQSEEINLENFYPRMIKELTRVLKTKGLMIILTAQGELLEKSIHESSSLGIQNKYQVLISGKKATVYKITKNKDLTSS